MENFKFVVISIIILIILGLGGYWAFTTIESGSTHAYNQKIKDLKNENEKLSKELDLLKSKAETSSEENKLPEEENIKIETKKTEVEKPIVSKYQNLVDRLQKMVDDNIYLKLKSKGVMVGSIQEFFNIYNKTSNKIDNDFGVKLETTVKNFQKAQGVAVSGQVGPNTLKAMIVWLKSH